MVLQLSGPTMGFCFCGSLMGLTLDCVCFCGRLFGIVVVIASVAIFLIMLSCDRVGGLVYLVGTFLFYFNFSSILYFVFKHCTL